MLPELITGGLAGSDEAMLALRVGVGSFFAASGWNKLRDHQRHATFVATLKEDKVPLIGFNQWWVPSNELLGGIAVAIGLATPLAAAVLFILIVVACICEAKKRVDAYQPINKVDRYADYLYLPEVLYAVVLAAIVAAGAGKYSLDAFIF
jgi:putative oxidoreductase